MVLNWALAIMVKGFVEKPPLHSVSVFVRVARGCLGNFSQEREQLSKRYWSSASGEGCSTTFVEVADGSIMSCLDKYNSKLTSAPPCILPALA